jgi:hypothetical protein
MKTTGLLFFAFAIVTGCFQGNRPESVKTDKVNLNFNLSSNDTTAISIVKPSAPEITITVGGTKADITGFTSDAIQTAADAIHNSGRGGTVKLLPGNFIINAPVRLYDNMSLVGSGERTVLKKCSGFRSAFAIDADYGEYQITVTDASGFSVGMGVAIYDDGWRGGWDLTTAKITSIKGNVLYIDEHLLRDYHTDKNGTVSNNCSVISAVDVCNIIIADLVVDGSRESNDMVDGCRAGGIYLHKVTKALVENVKVKNFNSDGISWQLTEYVTVKNCEVSGCANSGLHPGTGSPYSVIEGNNSHNNDGYGLFICWRVRNSFVRNNSFSNNGINGICTGHKDTDVLFTGNHIFENGADGISLRGESPLNAPHRSVFRNNIIENNGMRQKGYGFSVNCLARGVVLEDNIIRNTGKGNQVAAVLLTANSLPVEMKNNKISGHPDGEVITEKK